MKFAAADFVQTEVKTISRLKFIDLRKHGHGRVSAENQVLFVGA